MFKDLARAGSGQPLGAEIILYGDREATQKPQRLARLAFLINGFGLSQRLVGIYP